MKEAVVGQKKRKSKKEKATSLGEDIISGLQEIVDYKKGKLDLRTTSMLMPEPPEALSKGEI